MSLIFLARPNDSIVLLFQMRLASQTIKEDCHESTKVNKGNFDRIFLVRAFCM